MSLGGDHNQGPAPADGGAGRGAAQPGSAPGRAGLGDVVETLARLLKATAVYPPDHPRVREPALEVAPMLERWITPPNWFRLRVRGQELVVAGQTVAVESPLVAWMRDRLREAGLAGVEFGPRVDAASVIEFAAVLGRCRSRSGASFVDRWPENHAKIRPLDLVFAGTFSDAADARAASAAAAVADSEGRGTAAEEVWKLDVVQRLAGTAAVQQRLQTIQAQCDEVQAIDEELVGIDLVTNIVDLLPMEVVAEDGRLDEVVVKALDQVRDAVCRLIYDGGEVIDAGLLRSALGVAKKYFGRSAVPTEVPNELPTGRPEDDRITADLHELLAEVDKLPPSNRLPRLSREVADPSDPELAAELCGIYLHVLQHSERAETRAALVQVLPRALRAADAKGHPDVVDVYLGGGGGDVDGTSRSDLIVFLERAGCGELLLEGGFLTGELFLKTFPQLLPTYARLFGRDSRGIEQLRLALADVAEPMLGPSAEALARSGDLDDKAVYEPLLAVGGASVLPFVQQMIELGRREVRPALVRFLRDLRLPDPEAAALRCIEPATALPAGYLADLCRMARAGMAHDERARRYSGQLLRAYAVEGTAAAQGLERHLFAIAGLRHLPGPETEAVLLHLARDGRFTRLGAAARAVRKQAREVLGTIEGR